MKSKKGITLIALVITIIVLLILAGVTIQMIVGKNGIVNRAINASEETTDADIEEMLKMGLGGLEGDFIGLWNEDNTLNFYDCLVGSKDELNNNKDEDPKILFEINGYQVKLGKKSTEKYSEDAEKPRKIEGCRIQKLDKDKKTGIGSVYTFDLVEESIYGLEVEKFERADIDFNAKDEED